MNGRPSGVLPTSYTPTTCGLRIDAVASASRWKRDTTSGCRVYSGCSTLIANRLPGSRVWRASYTRPMPPSPMTRTIE